jgi:hypothetical protein
MMTKNAQHSCRSSRLILLSAVAAIGVLVGGTAYACPLGNHDSPRVRLLHALQHKGQHAPSHGVKLAQLQSQTPSQTATHAKPARTELGAYGRDLPHGAAAPTSETKPILQKDLGSLAWAIADTRVPEAQAYFDQGYRLGWGFNRSSARPDLRHVLVG